MSYFTVIEKLVEEILSDKIDYVSLKERIEAYEALLINLSGLDLKDEKNRHNDIALENGTALGTAWAAMCVVDTIRTRQFMRGIWNAVEDLYKKKTKPIKILYAGTGPFATLILPLITRYTAEELQLVLLEVNEETIVYLKRVLKKLEIENYVAKIVCEDATQYEIAEPQDIDILISETMQHALVKEQQVPIMLNLVNQLNDNVVLIPEKIQLKLALMNTDTQLILKSQKASKYKEIATLLEFDKTYINLHNATQDHPVKKSIELIRSTPFKGEDAGKIYDKLVVLTSIQVYGTEWILEDASGLTVPKILLDLRHVDPEKKEISISYVMKGDPYFEYELS